MPPNITNASSVTGVLYEDESLDNVNPNDPMLKAEKVKTPIVWRSVIFLTSVHIAGLYGLYLALFSARWYTILFATFLYYIGGVGITAGAHRLWAHKSYKAKWPLRFLLMIMNTVAFQDDVIHWARNHRVHHKYSETDADPHNAKRGFFFSHMGWLMRRMHPQVKAKGSCIDFNDLWSDPILSFQRKYYLILMPLLCFVMPAVIPAYFWNETWTNAFFVCSTFRYVCTLHATWLVNSVAHFFGNKPYDRYINPAENLSVAVFALGEGWHNYHHVFPWDYKTAELGNYKYNFTTAFIDFFARIGWAYDLKTVSTEMVKQRVERTGDGTHDVWGWGDKDQSQEERDQAIIMHYDNRKQK